MKCQFCDNVATVHLTNIVNKAKSEMHLCDGCAREKNLIPDDPVPQVDVKALLGLLVQLQHAAPEPPAAGDPSALTCEMCGLKYGEFRAEGRLGCVHDYDEFRPLLEPLLERIHRAVTHEGKVPRSALRKKSRAELRGLRKQLQQAIKAERYEDAARLRDTIREKEAQG